MSDAVVHMTPDPVAAFNAEADTPKTIDEAKAFDDGFKAGLTAYACAVGHSGLKRENPELARLMDAQGWKTIEWFEKIAKAKV